MGTFKAGDKVMRSPKGAIRKRNKGPHRKGWTYGWIDSVGKFKPEDKAQIAVEHIGKLKPPGPTQEPIQQISEERTFAVINFLQAIVKINAVLKELLLLRDELIAADKLTYQRKEKP